MQRKSWIVITVVFLLVGVAVGWLTAGRLAAKDSERYTMDALSYARHAQAKERASLVRLLESKEVQKAEDLLYTVLTGNFKDYGESTDSEDLIKACELSKLLGPSFAAATQETVPDQPKSRQALAESVRSLAQRCGDVK